MTELSVIIPTLDEAGALPPLIRQLRTQQGVEAEIIVADGGSRDATVRLAAAAGARVVQAPRGRGAQMNAAARQAQGEFLLFLHADSELPLAVLLRDALAALRAGIATFANNRCAGHFALQFKRREPGRERFYRYLQLKSTLNRPFTANGDQGLLLHRDYFRELGGFDERLPFLEDQRIGARIWQTGHWITLPGTLLTSARRFEREGHWQRYTLMALMMGMHAAGAEEFFARAAGAYAAQSETRKLRLGPYLAAARQVLGKAGWRRASGILYRAGRFVRSQSWQPFFWLDVRLRGESALTRQPLLAFHDRLVRPVTDNRVADVLATILMSFWFLMVLPVFCTLTEPDSRFTH